jgi:hypothetical protein
MPRAVSSVTNGLFICTDWNYAGILIAMESCEANQGSCDPLNREQSDG